MTTSGAPAALHGYRVQALYTLNRILNQASDNLIFHPENLEDLDVLDGKGQTLELIQVKKYSPLQLSNLEPEKSRGFFRRALDAIKSVDPPIIKLVNFGNIGPELKKAWDGDKKKRLIIKEKFRKQGYKDFEIELLLDKIEMVEVDESSEELEVYSLLSNLHTGIDPAKAFDLLHYWIFISMENQSQITYSDVVETLNSVGRWQAERSDYHEQWFTTIQPFEVPDNITENYDSLKKEFFEGGFTKYDHIIADLDFPRNDKEAKIKAAFLKSNIVIVHAASGQGKTTLALRYLHNHYPNGWRFSIVRIENVQHALSVANALSGFASAIQAPMMVYIDVNPSDRDWIELTRQLVKHRYLQILITIREEDYKRANTLTTDFDFEQIDLQFNENEAEQIYERAKDSIHENHFLNFSAAWDQFGNGPLLEFVYLLTQTKTLRQRLESQIVRIQSEVREKNLDTNEIHLLRLVAVATAFEARINTRLLIKSLQLRSPTTTLSYFEKEYLIRLSDEGYLEGLHAIRSIILVDLLTDTDFNRWIDLAVEVLSYLEEEDIEQFVLNAAIERTSEFEQLHQSLMSLQPNTWRGIASVLRGFLWIDINQYVIANKQVIKEAKAESGAGWYFVANLALASDDASEIGKWWESDGLSSLVSDERRERLNAIQAMQPPKDKMFDQTKLWLEYLSSSYNKPENLQDWIGVSFVLYWASFLAIKNISPPTPDPTLPFFVLADVIYAFNKYTPSQYDIWLNEYDSNLLKRLADEMQVICLESDGTLLTTHFLVVTTEIEQRQNKDPFHAAAIERLQLIRQIYPSYEKYGIQGYGHRLGEALKLDIDGTRKPGVERRYLVPSLVTWGNGLSTGIARYSLRLENWSIYVEEVLKRRQAILICLNQLNQGLQSYIRNRKSVNIGQKYLENDVWESCFSILNDHLELPRSAVDPWGFSSETRDESNEYLTQSEHSSGSFQNTPKAIAYKIYQPFLEAQRKYFFHFHNYLTQSVNVIVTNFNLGKIDNKYERESVEKELKEHGIKTDGAHLCSHNFWDAKQNLLDYQQQFRHMFEHIVGEQLSEIESNEKTLIQQTWLLWHHFALNPARTYKNPIEGVTRNEKNSKAVIDRWIKGVLSRFSNQERNAKRLPLNLNWDGKPTLVIQLDVINPTLLYDAFSEVMENLNLQFRSLKYEDLKHYLFQENYENIIVIPTFRGRMVNENAWTLYALSTILNKTSFEEHNWVSYQMQPLTQEWIDASNLEFWDHPKIKKANKISATVSGLMILISQVGELAALPEEMNEAGMELLQSYTTDRSKILGELLQKFIDHGTTIQNELNNLSDDEIMNRPFLAESVALFHELYEYVMPPNSENGRIHLDDEMINEYAEQLSHVALDAEYLRLLLISDALDN